MYKGSTSGLYPELSQALSPEGQLSRRRHGARRVGGALQLPHSGFPNPRIFHAALLLGLDRICLQATLVSVSQLELGRAPRQQSCSSARSARRCSSELRFQKARSLCPRGLCARDCVSCWGPGSVLWAPLLLLKNLLPLFPRPQTTRPPWLQAPVLASSSSRSDHLICGLQAFRPPRLLVFLTAFPAILSFPY